MYVYTTTNNEPKNQRPHWLDDSRTDGYETCCGGTSQAVAEIISYSYSARTAMPTAIA
jgi:hypothetical protein